jgi:hypothetical protein
MCFARNMAGWRRIFNINSTAASKNERYLGSAAATAVRQKAYVSHERKARENIARGDISSENWLYEQRAAWRTYRHVINDAG